MQTRTILKLAAGVGAIAGARAILRRQRKIHLRGQVVVITGGSRGLGLVLARQLIARGARVAIAARLYGMAPNLVDEAFGLIARLMPALNNDRTTVEGKDAEAARAPSVLRTLSDEAALRNNEL